MGTDSDAPADPLRRQVEDLAAQVRRLGQQIDEIREQARAFAGDEQVASDDAMRRRDRRDRRRDIMTIYLSLLCFAVVAGALLLIGRSIDNRHDLGKEQLKAQSHATQQAMPTPPPAAAAADVTARDIVERYIERQARPAPGERQAQPAPGDHQAQPAPGGLGVSVSVNGVIDLVKSLGKAGVIGAKTVSDLTAELTKQGADVAAHTLRALVDKYLGPRPTPEKPAETAGGMPGQQVLVNVYPGERRAVTVTPPIRDPAPRKPGPPCTRAPTAAIAAAPPR